MNELCWNQGWRRGALLAIMLAGCQSPGRFDGLGRDGLSSASLATPSAAQLAWRSRGAMTRLPNAPSPNSLTPPGAAQPGAFHSCRLIRNGKSKLR